jgi:hypothetical protein
MSRNGKIARLPHRIREELNLRLEIRRHAPQESNCVAPSQTASNQ